MPRDIVKSRISVFGAEKPPNFGENYPIFGKKPRFSGIFRDLEPLFGKGECMRKRDPRTKCIKRKVLKCDDVLRAYDKVQNAYADKLEADDNVISFICNVPIEDTARCISKC